MIIKCKKYISAILIVQLTVVILFVVCLYVYKLQILRSTTAPIFIKSLVTLFLPPRDLYTPLATREIEISSVSELVPLKFQNKYLGWHSIRIFYEKSDSIPLVEKINLSSKIQCYIGNKLILSKDIVYGEPYLAEGGVGFILTTYEVPDDLPLDVMINCGIYLYSDSRAKLAQFGKLKFIVQKFSDL